VKRIAILGSTGSIGCNTLDVISRFPDRFKVVALSAGEKVDALAEQVRRFRPDLVSLATESAAEKLKAACPQTTTQIYWGVEGLIRVATHPTADMVVSAIVGSAGLIPTLAAIKAGKNVALANKETLVMAGELVTSEARKNNVRIVPVDSEHSAIFQVLQGSRREDIKRVILTASGGPFLRKPRESLERVTPQDALKHPNWIMGAKITLDSATLMNKGLEVIEAHWLFDIPVFQIEVVIHPQSIIHSLVEFTDGSVLSQMGRPDMRVPIAYSLSYPERLDLPLPSLDLIGMGNLTFEAPDLKSFPCLSFAYEALEEGGTMPAVLNAANEVAVHAFMEGRIGFLDISEVIRETLKMARAHPEGSGDKTGEKGPTAPSRGKSGTDPLETILQVDRLSRERAERIIGSKLQQVSSH
jgi:1-deoxy-D-xylulose-5-phosphate reductoisomerase